MNGTVAVVEWLTRRVVAPEIVGSTPARHQKMNGRGGIEGMENLQNVKRKPNVEMLSNESWLTCDKGQASKLDDLFCRTSMRTHERPDKPLPY